MSSLLIQRFGGAPLLLIICLFVLYGHLSERSDRQRVLAQGHTVLALAHEPSGTEYVTVTWTDDAGHQRSDKAWTSKAFARQVRQKRGSVREAIKYIDSAGAAPVILSEAAKREWENTWWIYTTSGMSLLTLLMTMAIMVALFRGRGNQRAKGSTL